MSTLFADQRCRHGVSYAHRCAECLQIGLAQAEAERRHSCHVPYRIEGKACPMPTRQSDDGCAGCVHHTGGDHA